MNTAPTAPARRTRRRYKKSRFGCRNCKLRRVKCDESKPQCQRCKNYGVLCNFTPGAPDLETPVAVSRYPRVEGANQLCLDSSLPRSLNLPAICTDGVNSFEMDAPCMTRLEQFRMRTLDSFSTEMTKIWQHRVPYIAFRNPYLMHTLLAVAAAHERHRDMPASSHRTRIETHHSSQCVLLFNQKLSHPISVSDRDPLWSTAALMGMMTTASFDAASPEEAWPLRPSSPSDLQWFRLSNEKKTRWNLTDPLRPGGIFRAMAHEYAELQLELPTFGAEGIPTALAEVCNISDSSDQDNPYFAAAHVLSRLQRLSDSESAGIQTVSFLSQSQSSFRSLLRKKDPVALLLLSLWYARSSGVLWWIKQRARVENRAIRLYLERAQCDDRIQQLLPSPVELHIS
ncbi:hypothetical protein AK830_g7166 [Neonectria ditissima]|uniref:Zn(2)-C6 fungal-type domain-containing protein n=1 Tax=Neonectria ditissima TaxID=78410 RepID=A0A0P7AXV0_9HYPO|nr:hypothetical protein AK830_g7166 [Neonectria ditissima]